MWPGCCGTVLTFVRDQPTIAGIAGNTVGALGRFCSREATARAQAAILAATLAATLALQEQLQQQLQHRSCGTCT